MTIGTDLGHLLGAPAWQGVGAIVGVAAIALYAWFEIGRRGERHRRSSEGLVELIDVSAVEGEQQFYQRLNRSVKDAQESVLRFASGFTRQSQEAFLRELVHTEEEALRRGIEITRIQTGQRVLEPWAESYASLVEMFPQRLRVLAGFADPPLVDLGLVDPYGANPLILLIFELREPSMDGPRSRLATAVFLQGQPQLAASLADQFVARAHLLSPMTPTAVRELARSYVYFAYGVHMARSILSRDVPDAKCLGRAVLQDWSRDLRATVSAAAGNASAIYRKDGGHVEGVAYELSAVGKRRLDDIEARAYQVTPVTIKVDGEQHPAYTYMPLDASGQADPLPSGSSLELLIEGARENGLAELVAQLEQARGHVGG